MANKHYSGVVPAEKVRGFISNLAHEMWFYRNDEIKGKATIKDGYVNTTFQIGDVELAIKVKHLTPATL